MGTTALVLVLLVAGFGVPLLVLAADRWFSRRASLGKQWIRQKPPAVDVELEKFRLASRHGLSFGAMQTIDRTVSRGRPVEPADRAVAVALATVLLEEEATEGASFRRLRTLFMGLAVLGVLVVAWSLLEPGRRQVSIGALGPVLQAMGFELQVHLRRRRYAGARRTLEVYAAETRP